MKFRRLALFSMLNYARTYVSGQCVGVVGQFFGSVRLQMFGEAQNFRLFFFRLSILCSDNFAFIYFFFYFVDSYALQILCPLTQIHTGWKKKSIKFPVECFWWILKRNFVWFAFTKTNAVRMLWKANAHKFFTAFQQSKVNACTRMKCLDLKFWI